MNGPYKCEFCSRTLLRKTEPYANTWDWITGYLPKTVHCCPQCQRTRKKDWLTLIEKSKQKPPAQSSADNWSANNGEAGA